MKEIWMLTFEDGEQIELSENLNTLMDTIRHLKREGYVEAGWVGTIKLMEVS